MTDLRDHLDAIGGARLAPSSDQVSADLTRGRGALRRRRTGQAVGGTVLAVAVAAAFSVSYAGDSPPAPPTASRPATATAFHLVDYRGAQPKGFTIDKVPDGWFVQFDQNYVLTMAPDRAKNPGPNVKPSSDPIYDAQSYIGKIAILLAGEEYDVPKLPSTQVEVGDRTGTLVKALPAVQPGNMSPSASGDTGWSLWVPQAKGVHLVVQFPPGLGMSQNEMAALAAGVHVHKATIHRAG